jgi:hypothetical protein
MAGSHGFESLGNIPVTEAFIGNSCRWTGCQCQGLEG